MRIQWKVLKIVVEPSGAVSYAPFVDDPRWLAGSRVGLIVSGGNIDPDALPWSNAQAAFRP